MKSLIEFINEAKRGAYISLADDETQISNIDNAGWKSEIDDLEEKINYKDSEGLSLNRISFKLANNGSKYAFDPYFDKTPNKTMTIRIDNCGATKKKYCVGLQTDGLMYLLHGILNNNEGTLTGEVKYIDGVGDEIMELFAKQIKNLTIE